ncbi:hypothetical protein HPB48_017272 [Haemaphysalis longicornis]|uniref:Uncharacterized protein n=1 Tax=Haemaphysalis longicornis TaxID=44386 RepID=A0A9J6FVB4_HAELO|nr:hypothetical protein HPB48_017272 [Haemaphysalis longicornis]
MAHHGRKLDAGGSDNLRATVRAEWVARGAVAAGGRRWFLEEVLGPAGNGGPSANGSTERRELPALIGSGGAHCPEEDGGHVTCPRAGREPALYVGCAQPFAGCTVAEQDEVVTGTDCSALTGDHVRALPHTVYFEHHYSGRVHTEKAEAAAGRGRGRVRKRGQPSTPGLLGTLQAACGREPCLRRYAGTDGGSSIIIAATGHLAPTGPAPGTPRRLPHRRQPHRCCAGPPGSPPHTAVAGARAPLEPVGQPPDAAEPGMVGGAGHAACVVPCSDERRAPPIIIIIAPPPPSSIVVGRRSSHLTLPSQTPETDKTSEPTPKRRVLGPAKRTKISYILARLDQHDERLTAVEARLTTIERTGQAMQGNMQAMQATLLQIQTFLITRK